MARKASTRVTAITKKLWKSRLTFLCVGMLLGTGIGVGVSYIARSTSQQPHSQQTSTPSYSQQELLETSYTNAKKRIDQDLQSGALSKDKADKVTQKLTEAYDYRKQTLGNKDSSAIRELSKKRQEWREWSRDNGVSVKYLSGLH